MYLTLSKRFEFSASHRCFVPAWDDARNSDYFGDEARGQFGHGHNYVAFFVFHGDIDPSDGMIINVTDIKRHVLDILAQRYDHKFLNEDTPAFLDRVPTPENIARELLQEAQRVFSGGRAEPVICHLEQSSRSGATAYADGRVDSHHWIEFSAARRTFSPHLSDNDNNELFGIAAAKGGHGHHYRLRVTLEGVVDNTTGCVVEPTRASEVLSSLHNDLDHRNLNTDVSALKGKPITTEYLCQYILERLGKDLPVRNVKVYENPEFFAEYDGDLISMGVVNRFNAAHRLHSPVLSDDRNLEVYGKCDNVRGHGHEYIVETTLAGKPDNRTGVLYKLDDVYGRIDTVLAEWNYKHLDRETEDFADRISSAENIVSVLWQKLDRQFGEALSRVRLWETPNNRFTARRSIE